MSRQFTNRLIHESSPYLRQHAHQPVDWYPWGEEALSRARQEDKPILLSIGYSACHWCHVMAKECFENEAIARLMNERFINIKVDREERPDLDEIYLQAVQLMTGRGGWPLTVFLTPDLVPFYGGTYFPPEDRFGLPGFPKVLRAISEFYRERRQDIHQIEAQMKAWLQALIKIPSEEKNLEPAVIKEAFIHYRDQFDFLHGGFGRAPKFPDALNLLFLLRYWKSRKEEQALEMVEKSLTAMAAGGIRDHLGGGFHRYSTDERWLIPHFEKMLYDNALLSRLYFEAYQATRKKEFREVGESILDYIQREMTSPEGGFFSSQDADSDGEEGKFYVWEEEEIRRLLGEERASLFSAYYGVSSEGNFGRGKNVLHLACSLEKISSDYQVPPGEVERILEEGRKRLFQEREKRSRPPRDEKIITSWNGLMISGFVYGFMVTGMNKYLFAAEKAASFILEEMFKEGKLRRIYSGGKAYHDGCAEDYALLIQALLDLYEVTFKEGYLIKAQELQEIMMEKFWDKEADGFFFTEKEELPFLGRFKQLYDQAIPSSNSVAVMNLVRLGYLDQNESWKKMVEDILRIFYPYLTRQAIGFSHLLSGFLFYLEPEEIKIMGPKEDPMIKDMIREIYLNFLPHKILSFQEAAEPAVIICRGFTCLPPIKDVQELSKILK
jgi:uncharacterized protein YyaL (SSP411 family)